jgi:hypothetical protein
MPAYLMETDLKDLWSLLSRTMDVKTLSNEIIHARPPRTRENPWEVDYEESESEFLASALILSSKTPIVSFIVNPLNHGEIAFASHRCICDLDVECARKYQAVCFFEFRSPIHLELTWRNLQ